MQLELEGYNVCKSVASGDEALSMAALEKPDPVLMHIKLTGKMDGITAAALIKKEFKVPIIFMISYSRLDYPERAREISPIGYLNKPVEVDNIKPVIDGHFAKAN